MPKGRANAADGSDRASFVIVQEFYPFTLSENSRHGVPWRAAELADRGVQTWDVPAGAGMCFELMCDIAGEFPFVKHGFGHGQKGAIGILIVV